MLSGLRVLWNNIVLPQMVLNTLQVPCDILGGQNAILLCDSIELKHHWVLINFLFFSYLRLTILG